MLDETEVKPQEVSAPAISRDSAEISKIIPAVIIPPVRKKGRPRGRPFVKGDPRIRKTGTPLKKFADLRKIALSIADKKAFNKRDGKMYAIAELILMEMAQSKDPREHQKFLEICYGKVPESFDITTAGEKITSMTDKEMADRVIAIFTAVRVRMAKQLEEETKK